MWHSKVKILIKIKEVGQGGLEHLLVTAKVIQLTFMGGGLGKSISGRGES
jgi:hypothetical protein